MLPAISPRRSSLGALVCAVAAALTVAAGVVTPAYAAPSPTAIEAQIDKAWNQLEPVIEQYNHIHSQLQVNRNQQKKMVKQLKPLQSKVDAALSHVGDLAARAYMQGDQSGLTSMLVNGSPSDLTDKLTYLDLMARSQRAQVNDVITLRDKYAKSKKTLDTVTAGLAARDADLAGKKKDIEKKINDLQKLRITAYGSSGGGARGALRTGACPAEYSNDPGGRAAVKACSLIGKPYIWAAAGPRGYDCSGLTLTAWAVSGVSLRHYTKWQWSDTTPVGRADIEPGDLVFWFSDLHHMGIYVGNDTVVHAPHTGDYVRMAGLDDIGPIAGFRRPS